MLGLPEVLLDLCIRDSGSVLKIFSDGFECQGFVGCWVGLVVVSVTSTSGVWCQLVWTCSETAFHGVRVCLLVWFRALVWNYLL
jgi:hypothetical protein